MQEKNFGCTESKPGSEDTTNIRMNGLWSVMLCKLRVHYGLNKHHNKQSRGHSRQNNKGRLNKNINDFAT